MGHAGNFALKLFAKLSLMQSYKFVCDVTHGIEEEEALYDSTFNIATVPKTT